MSAFPIIDTSARALPASNQRIIEENVETLADLLHQICAKRVSLSYSNSDFLDSLEQSFIWVTPKALDEIAMIPAIPASFAPPMNTDPYKSQALLVSDGLNNKIVHSTVVEQLEDYICEVAALYGKRERNTFVEASQAAARALKSMSCKAKFDPLTTFTAFLAALVQNVGNVDQEVAGIYQGQESRVHVAYGNRCISKQNSLDVAWDLLMEEAFKDLRRAIYTTEEEFWYFRRLLVKCVMATETRDERLQTERTARYNHAMQSPVMSSEESYASQTLAMAELIIHCASATSTEHNANVTWVPQFLSNANGVRGNGTGAKQSLGSLLRQAMPLLEQ